MFGCPTKSILVAMEKKRAEWDRTFRLEVKLPEACCDEERSAAVAHEKALACLAPKEPTPIMNPRMNMLGLPSPESVFLG